MLQFNLSLLLIFFMSKKCTSVEKERNFFLISLLTLLKVKEQNQQERYHKSIEEKYINELLEKRLMALILFLPGC